MRQLQRSKARSRRASDEVSSMPLLLYAASSTNTCLGPRNERLRHQAKESRIEAGAMSKRIKELEAAARSSSERISELEGKAEAKAKPPTPKSHRHTFISPSTAPGALSAFSKQRPSAVGALRRGMSRTSES